MLRAVSQLTPRGRIITQRASAVLNTSNITASSMAQQQLQQQQAPSLTKLWIDCDAGVDDAQGEQHTTPVHHQGPVLTTCELRTRPVHDCV